MEQISYEATRLKALHTGKTTEYKAPKSLWTCIFVPLRPGIVREVGLSDSGHIVEGPCYRLHKGTVILF